MNSAGAPRAQTSRTRFRTSSTHTWVIWVLSGLMIFALSALGAVFRFGDTNAAAWWPAAGASAWFVLATARKRRAAAVVLVAAAITLGTLVGIDQLNLALTIGITDAIEVLSFLLLLEGRQHTFVLRTVRDATRLIVAAIAASAVTGLFLGLLISTITGETFLALAVHTAASHASAIVLIAPFAALPPPMKEAPRVAEIAFQSVLLIVAIVTIFGAAGYVPLAFVPLTLLGWAAFRFPVYIALIQSIATGTAALLFTLAGLGPYAATTLTLDTQVTILSSFLLALAMATVLLVTAQNEVNISSRAATESAKILSSGFIDSQVGLILTDHDDDDTWTIRWANRTAREFIATEVSADGRWQGQLATEARAALELDGAVSHCVLGSGATVNVVANHVGNSEKRVAVQIVDVTASVLGAEKRLEAEREHARALATRLELERQRDDFIATTSHELRTPIMSIAGYAELLEESSLLRAPESGWLRAIARNADRLTALVESLLTLGRASAAPELHSPPDLLPACALVEDVVSMHCPLADIKNVTLSIEVEEGAEDCVVYGVAHDVNRAIANLVSNAVKFTPADGTVRVITGTADAETTITVTDTGPGISEDAMAHIFERFYRAPDAERSSTPGTGLGLSITAELARRNGGTVTVDSVPGAGVTATLRFPAAARHR
ncbi:signal transduction histidine kinase [Microbacterium halimionae]|uniref:histidine kinase n=1 Tax=Microbacterium halimionae TaxID=1526413 RepID=A0A7W3JPW9_9MICO|nr:ATP-binding protein [Microbacterium halimionae]MBA8816849.1 signal transduction histidine kinase [Microbacterium halimionae]NII94855.1 signal transduction histidine kinase [Microbacterium halimionae]